MPSLLKQKGSYSVEKIYLILAKILIIIVIFLFNFIFLNRNINYEKFIK